jgi:hypothetical protein
MCINGRVQVKLYNTDYNSALSKISILIKGYVSIIKRQKVSSRNSVTAVKFN